MTKLTHLFAASLLLMTVLSFNTSAKAQTVQSLQAQVDMLLELTASMRADDENVYFEGVNVHVRNGSGSTDGTQQCRTVCRNYLGTKLCDQGVCDSATGVGNLIVGYDEYAAHDPDGYPAYPESKTGSHNIVVGFGHHYTNYGGLVAGRENQIGAPYATVTGGRLNKATASYSSVSGGYRNQATGSYSSVSGGRDNVASGSHSSVSGGRQHVASGYASAVSGGRLNKATQNYSSVSGGNSNVASGYEGSVSGGRYNEAKGTFSSVSGGKSNVAQASYSSVSGGNDEAAIYDYSWATDHIVSHAMVSEVSTGVRVSAPLNAVEFLLSH